MEKYRQIAVKKLGWIRIDTEESKRAEKVFAEYKKQSLKPAGLEKQSFWQYYTSYDEYEAYLSQKVFENQITGNKDCLFSMLKKCNKSFINLIASDTGVCKYLSKELKQALKSDDELLISFLHLD